MKKEDSYILQVDESTKSLMSQIQNGITSDLYEQFDSVKRNITDSIEENISSINSKLKLLADLESSLNSLSHFNDQVSQINTTIETLEKHLISNLECIKDNNTQDFSKATKKITNGFSDINKLIELKTEALSQHQTKISKENASLLNQINSCLENIVKQESKQNQEISQRLTNIENELRIVKEFVTPFWKKNKKNKEEDK